MSSITKKRVYVKRPAPEDVTVEWLELPEPGDLTLAGVVRLNGGTKWAAEYRFSQHLDQRTGEVTGWRFCRPDPKGGEALVYDVDATSMECCCMDCQHQRRLCKHGAAVGKLLADLDGELAAAEQARLDAEQAADRAGEPFDWPSDEELAAMAAEYEEEERCGSWCDADEPEPFRYGVGA